VSQVGLIMCYLSVFKMSTLKIRFAQMSCDIFTLHAAMHLKVVKNALA